MTMYIYIIKAEETRKSREMGLWTFRSFRFNVPHTYTHNALVLLLTTQEGAE